MKKILAGSLAALSLATAANAQAVELAKRFPDRRFAVFKLSGVVATQELPTHKTLGGVVVVAIKSPVWDIKTEV